MAPPGGYQILTYLPPYSPAPVFITHKPHRWKFQGGDKVEGQKVPESLFNDLYETLQEPEKIYEEYKKGKDGKPKPYRTFHFVKDKNGKTIKVVLQDKGDVFAGYNDGLWGLSLHGQEQIWGNLAAAWRVCSIFRAPLQP